MYQVTGMPGAVELDSTGAKVAKPMGFWGGYFWGIVTGMVLAAGVGTYLVLQAVPATKLLIPKALRL